MKTFVQNIRFICILVVMAGFLSIDAGAAIHFVKPNDSAELLVQNEIFSHEATSQKSHAPEPTTLMLFASGLLSMIVGFFRRTYAMFKRGIDIIGSVAGLVILSPVLVVVGAIIKITSPGPILYTQIRVGKNGEHFKIYKFRSMRTDAETGTGPVWASKNDNRLIPIGKFIRKTRIDEIPQFFNVLKGDMSIIGPRPERPTFVEQFKKEITDYDKRLNVKPGITGLAQVWHHYDEDISDVRKKIKYDILYIKNVCFWTDMSILARTVRVVLTGAGAK